MKLSWASLCLTTLFSLQTVGQVNFGGNNGNRNSNNGNGRRPNFNRRPDRRPNNGGGFSSEFNSIPNRPNKNPSIKDLLGNKAPAVNTRFFGVTTRKRGDQCTTPLNKPGKCSYIFEPRCASVLQVIVANGINQNVLAYLLSAIRAPCGFEGFDFTLCCEDNSQPLITEGPISTPPTTPSPGTNPTQSPTTTTQPPNQFSRCGTPLVQSKIVGGIEARQGAWPWAVILGRRSGSRFQVMCGGTLLNEDTILTAAHCFDQSGINMVRLGDHDITTTNDGASPTDVSIRQRIQHPGWDSNTLDNDIAIIKLSRSITYSRNIMRACLPDSYLGQDLASLLKNPPPTIVGWGSTQSGGGSQDRLRQAQVPMVTQQTCADAYRRISRVTIGDNKMCAGEGKIDTCNGDSGGALLANKLDGNAYSVVGITSFGVDCARPDFPGVYTRVDQYLSWIRSWM